MFSVVARCLFYLLALWLPLAQANGILDAEEQQWLDQKQQITIGFAPIPPFLNVDPDTGDMAGISVDYLRAIEQQLDTEFQFLIFPNYGAMIGAIRDRQVDAVFAVSRTPERDAFLNFTPVYAHLANKIFTRRDEYQSAEMRDFEGKRFAVPARTALVEYIQANYPLIELVETRGLGNAFNQLAAGEVDAVGAYASSGYYFTKEKGIKTSLVGSVGYDYHIAFGSRSDLPLLNRVLTKGLNSLSSEDRAAIDTRWILPEDSQRMDVSTVQTMLLYIVIGVGMVGLFLMVVWNRSLKREITSREKVEKEVNFMAFHDELTALKNRRFFTSTLEEYVQQPVTDNHTTCIIVIGLDSFRQINDFFGHKIGDYLLQRVARRLRDRLPGNAVLARIGGDEFAILQRCEANTVMLSHLADLLIAEISIPVAYGDQSFTVGASAGIAIQKQQMNYSALLECADMALHHAKKENAGGHLYFTETMATELQERQQLAKALKTALETDQLFLMYQPQIDMRTGSVCGFEALARWLHPSLGMIRPDHFIEIAEQEGMIVTLGDKVLRMACLQGVDWLAQGIEFDRLAVNVSVKQFFEADFVSKVTDTLAETGFPAEKLELEITESLFLGDKPQVREAMQKLVSKGVCFAIDDFGTGFSSLLYLKEFPVSKLKLDQGFIAGIIEDNSTLQIVKASLSMGQAMNMEVIAEGVETPEQQALLASLGCDQAQGYLFCRPETVEKIDQALLQKIEARI